MSFSKSARKVANGITPVKDKREKRTSNEIDTTVVNTLHSAWTPKKGGVLNTQVTSNFYLILLYSLVETRPVDHSILSYISVFEDIHLYQERDSLLLELHL